MTSWKNECEACGRESELTIDTPKYGKICLECWANEMGEVVEKHPIVGVSEE